MKRKSKDDKIKEKERETYGAGQFLAAVCKTTEFTRVLQACVRRFGSKRKYKIQ